MQSLSLLQTQLFSMQDVVYRKFQSSLLPTLNPETIIGVRTPLLRKLAREMDASNERGLFATLPHRFYEENQLHAFLIERIHDFDDCIAALDSFLPYIDNWSTCDSMNPKILGKHKKALLSHIERWLRSSHTYTVRYAIKLLMTHFLDNDYDPIYPERIAAIESEEYYVNMMIAWYFATALAKQPKEILPYFQEHRLFPEVHKKALRKAMESDRITDEQKVILKSLN